MTVSYVNANRRDDLRAATLFVIDDERQARGFDPRVVGSADVPAVIRTFDEMLSVFPLESEVGDAIRTSEELPSWRLVLERMEPVWKLWPSYSADPAAMLTTREWAALREVVAECVANIGLWHEEVDYPVRLTAGAGVELSVDSWDELVHLDPASLEDARIEDSRGRSMELEIGPEIRLKRVGLPRPIPE
jgi:hypothetical protein